MVASTSAPQCWTKKRQPLVLLVKNLDKNMNPKKSLDNRLTRLVNGGGEVKNLPFYLPSLGIKTLILFSNKILDRNWLGAIQTSHSSNILNGSG